mmetsp:Transcript_29716/g.52159  ORF Transcript_29716/g.52159 Transcript_29716/m.52159 type:complete len:197 (-) Transcript_29716:46-636(-)
MAGTTKGDSWPPKFEEFFYIPNIIDYFRVVSLIIACQGSDLHFVIWYSISYLLDAIDGEAARYFNQCSKLGYYLDMAIDRFSSSLALYLASQKLDNLLISFTLLLSLLVVEILAHGVVMYYGEVLKLHQKEMGGDFTIVRLYLGSKKGLAFACISYEGFVLSLILQSPIWVNLVFLPGFVFRAAANTTRLYACLCR